MMHMHAWTLAFVYGRGGEQAGEIWGGFFRRWEGSGCGGGHGVLGEKRNCTYCYIALSLNDAPK